MSDFDIILKNMREAKSMTVAGKKLSDNDFCGNFVIFNGLKGITVFSYFNI